MVTILSKIYQFPPHFDLDSAFFENKPKHFIFLGVLSATLHPGPHIARHLNFPRNSIGLLQGLSYRGKPGGHFPPTQTIGGMGTSPHRC